MEKEKLLKSLEEEFEKVKKDLDLSFSLDDLDEIFFVRDLILESGFVSSSLSRQLASRVAETFMNWNQYIHGLIFTNPGNMIVMNEARMLNDDDKSSLNKLISKSMGLVSLNTLNGVTKDKGKEKEFFQDSVKFWNETFKPEIEKTLIEINKGWKGQEKNKK